MKKSIKTIIIVMLLISTCVLFTGCTGNATPASGMKNGEITQSQGVTTTITDGFGRSVAIPADTTKIVCSGAGCLRYIVYLGAQDKVVGVDSIEKTAQKQEGRAYALANPQFSSLPLIGEFRGKDDPEKIIGIGPEVIFKTFTSGTVAATSAAEADALQNKTGIPVVAFPYGSLRTDTEKKEMFGSLRLLGKATGKEARAEELIAYIDATIADLDNRTKDIPASQQKTVFVGGVSSAGAHGIISTEPAYPPFLWVHAKNIAAGSGTQHADISKETIVNGDPDVLFIDVGTTQMGGDEGAIGELKTNAAYANLKALKSGNVYGVLPYNFYSTNYETVLANGYYVGKVLYPDRFAYVDPQKKADEIYTKFVGKPTFSALNGNYQNLGFTKISLA